MWLLTRSTVFLLFVSDSWPEIKASHFSRSSAGSSVSHKHTPTPALYTHTLNERCPCVHFRSHKLRCGVMLREDRWQHQFIVSGLKLKDRGEDRRGTQVAADWRVLTGDKVLDLWSIGAFVAVVNYGVGYSGEVTHVASSATTFRPKTNASMQSSGRSIMSRKATHHNPNHREPSTTPTA